MSTFNIITFGKYKDKNITFPQLVIMDPSYFCWLVEAGFLSGRMRAEADAVYAIATQLELPLDKRDTHCIQELVDRHGKICAVQVSRLEDVRAIPADNEIRSKTLNLLRKTDGIGRKHLHSAFRREWLGGKRATKARLEAFFSSGNYNT